MEIRNLGRSGLRVSVVGLGCNNFGMRLDQDQTTAVVTAAMDAGITLFDTADMYGGRGKSEIYLGKALGARRKDIVLASKFGMATDTRIPTIATTIINSTSVNPLLMGAEVLDIALPV